MPERDVFARSDNRYAVLAHQPTDSAVTDIQADLFQLLGHPWPAIAAQTETRLFPDVRQRDQIGPLPTAGRTAAKGPQSARADADNMAQSLGREAGNMFFDKPEPHGFWPAKNWVAFLRNSDVSLHRQFL